MITTTTTTTTTTRGHQSPVYSSPVEGPVEEEEDPHSDEEEEVESELEEEEEEKAKPLPRGGSSSRRPKHSKDSLKRRTAKHLDEHSAVIRPSDTTFDCRRSKRNRVRPVNYWAEERPLYRKSITKDGNCVSTLVGVSSVRRIEPTQDWSAAATTPPSWMVNDQQYMVIVSEEQAKRKR
ncbi:hypothetical protein TYRP_023470 [Tyrophagus putrescentiae]|nr:hypothetical protein TYRP_023470 [Tyrophagus putrescentiae]